MKATTHFLCAFAFCWAAATASAMEGQYNFVSIGTDVGAGREVKYSQSSLGSMTFSPDGTVSSGGRSGRYLERKDGTVVLPGPLDPNTTLNARLSAGGRLLIGGNTEGGGNYSLLVAMRPADGVPVLSGTYHAVSFELLPGTGLAARAVMIEAAASSIRAELRQGGRGTISHAQLGTYEVSVSNAAEIILGARQTATSVAILVAVQAAVGVPSGLHWLAEFSVRPEGISTSIGSLLPAGSQARIYQRVNSARGVLDFRGANAWSWGAAGLGALESATMAYGSSGLTVGAVTGTTNPSLLVAVPAPAITASSVFLHPHGVLESSSNMPHGNPLAPRSLATLYGSKLATASSAATVLPLPTALAGTTVEVNGSPAPLLFVSDSQINLQIPEDATGDELRIIVKSSGTASEAVWARAAPTSPGLFTWDMSGLGAAIAVHADGRFVNTTDPARRGEIIVLFGNGLGAEGQRPLIRIGGIPAEILYSGPAPGFAGLDQINLRVPAGAPVASAVPLSILTTEGVSDTVGLPIGL